MHHKRIYIATLAVFGAFALLSTLLISSPVQGQQAVQRPTIPAELYSPPPPADKEIQSAGRFNDAVENANRYGDSKLSDVFAGVIVRDGRAVVRSTRLLTDAEQKESGTLLTETNPTFEIASISRYQLNAGVEAVTKDSEVLIKSGLEIVAISADELNGVIKVDVAEEDKTGTESELKSRHPGLPLRFSASNPATKMSRRDSPGLFKAGLWIGALEGCTSGFQTMSWQGLRLAVTAGHCGVVGTPVVHGGVQIGQIIAEQEGGNQDVAIIQLSAGQSSNWLYRIPNHLEPIQSFSTPGSGSTVCTVGDSSGYRCGTVYSTNTNLPLNNLYNMHCAYFPSVDGDSGGPVYQFGTGVGIVSVSNGTSFTCYTPITRTVSHFAMTGIFGPQPKSVTQDLSGKCMDADIAGGTGNGKWVKQWDCLGSGQQNQAVYVEPIYLGNGRWGENYTLKFAHNSRCVDFDLNNLNNGGIVQQWDCIAGVPMNQRFIIDRGVGLSNAYRSVQNGRCIDLDTSGNAYANGTKFHQWDCNLQRQQRFTLLER